MENQKQNITIIIPVINEEKIIKNILNYLLKYPSIEAIFVDGGSQDNTIDIIKKSGLKLICSPILCRSSQMNLGAKEAKGDILLFLHGDTFLPENFPQIIIKTIEKKDFVAGAFQLKIDSPKKVFRWLECLVKWRSHFFALPYGDQGIFLTKQQFEMVNGFEDLVIMEDFALMKKLKKIGKIYLTSEAVTTSARRWEKLGILKTTMINQIMIIGYYLGIENQKLANIYRKIKSVK